MWTKALPMISITAPMDALRKELSTKMTLQANSKRGQRTPPCRWRIKLSLIAPIVNNHLYAWFEGGLWCLQYPQDCSTTDFKLYLSSLLNAPTKTWVALQTKTIKSQDRSLLSVFTILNYLLKTFRRTTISQQSASIPPNPRNKAWQQPTLHHHSG